jgi:hypothetical protein
MSWARVVGLLALVRLVRGCGGADADPARFVEAAFVALPEPVGEPCPVARRHAAAGVGGVGGVGGLLFAGLQAGAELEDSVKAGGQRGRAVDEVQGRPVDVAVGAVGDGVAE